jgi:GT2 family glycosyltransferase
MPLFSVIIPTHNRAALVGDAVASVLAQPRPCQVIVVDDASTDGTADAVAAAFGDRLTLVRLPVNRGPGAARNAGLAVATGEYAAFLDSDDLWLPWTADTYAAVIDRAGRPAFIAGKPFIFDGDGAPNVPQLPPLATEPFDDYLASGDRWRWWGASSFVIRADALRAAGGFTDEWVNAEDADAALRVGTAGPFVQVTDPPTFAWRRHGPSAMSSTAKTVAGVRRLIDEEIAGHYPGGPGRARDRRRIITTYARPLSLDLLATDPSASWDLYRRTLRWHMALGRWRYLAGFPLRAATARRACRRSPGPIDN